MGDMAEVFRDMREYKQHQKRVTELRNMPFVRLLVFESGWQHAVLPGGYRFFVPTRYAPHVMKADFWPSSGKWAIHDRRKTVYGRGVPDFKVALKQRMGAGR